MQEIADQITLCAGLVDVFAKSVDGSGVGVREFPEKFIGDAMGLVGQVSDKCESYKSGTRFGGKES